VTEPTYTLSQIGMTTISDFDNAAGFNAVGAIAAAPTNVVPINTTIATIVYDAGATGYASVEATSMLNVQVGRLVIVNAAETVLITDVIPPIADTTIASIIYDAGATGLCTIALTAAAGTGQLDGPTFQDYTSRYDKDFESATSMSHGGATATPAHLPRRRGRV
jgi:hypothetical protein